MPRKTSKAPKRSSTAVVVKEVKRPKRGRASAVERGLVARLEHLRKEARQVTDAYLSNLESDVATLVDFLEGASEISAGSRPKTRTMRNWTAVLDGLDLKPRKGRRRDLRRIDAAVREMMKTAFE